VRIARLFATVEACGARFRSTGRVSTSSPVWDEAGVVPLTPRLARWLRARDNLGSHVNVEARPAGTMRRAAGPHRD
jgi:hypothetical protein